MGKEEDTGKKVDIRHAMIHRLVISPIETVAARILTPLNPFHYAPMLWRRNLCIFLSQLLLPNDCLDPNQNLKKVEELVSGEGYGLVVATRHFSNRDFLMLMGRVGKNSRATTRREDQELTLFVPLAYHQLHPGVKGFLEYFGVTPLTVVTEETVKNDKNVSPSGEELPAGFGFLPYIRTAAQALNRGELVFVAPSATRTAFHEPWQGRPIEALVRFTRGNNKVAFMSVGLDIPDVESYEEYRGFHFFRRYIITIGPLYEKLELLQIAKERSTEVDRVMADDIAMLVRPQSLGEAYRELQEQRLTQIEDF